MQSAPPISPSPTLREIPSRQRLWMGRILSGLIIAFMVLDIGGHFAMPGPVLQAFQKLGMPYRMGLEIAILGLIATVAYAVPRSAVLGAVMLTGYFGGAISIHLRAGSTPFECVFPAILGLITWAGIYLREPLLSRLIPLRR